MGHLPVMCSHVVMHLQGIGCGLIIDGTVGQGGHAEAILEQLPDAVGVVGLDRDPDAVAAASTRLNRFGSRFVAIPCSYADIDTWRPRLPSADVRGFLLDLGLSSVQLETRGRGFSYTDPDSLDMRFDPESTDPSVEDIVNTWPERDLADTFFRYGEERASRRIARAIIRRRAQVRIGSARDLADLISRVVHGKQSAIHPATRCFQALRIAANRELEHLSRGLDAAESILQPGGRLIVISFHSLEDRIVKNFLSGRIGRCTCPPHLPVCTCSRRAAFRIVTRHPELPTPEEISANPRARSAKLRCAERVVSEGDNP
ncbi:16S rRNA (cytosine(1402)-N(4))-methyltransferase RsmH [bacterium]|nr:16S rRNA (cytosine(1402)-N(4))-methyltransferase RsmH [candidate division CSSED10-310 bacterium]